MNITVAIALVLLLGIKTTVIYPATEKHIRKYEAQNIHLIEETPELYKCVTLPYLEKERFSLKVNIEI
jgi:m7GpppX diphosphatase